jgi:hypothetical protein
MIFIQFFEPDFYAEKPNLKEYMYLFFRPDLNEIHNHIHSFTHILD